MGDPVRFLKGVCVDNKTMQEGIEGARNLRLLNAAKVGSFDLVITGGNSVRLAFAGAGYAIQGDIPIRAYWCPFLAGGGLPGWVDVPRTNPVYRFVFTAAMQGCALVVTNSPAAPRNFRVFHNQHPEADTTWQAIQDLGIASTISSLGYDAYGNAMGADGGMTNAFNLLWRPPRRAWAYISQSNRFVPLARGTRIERDAAKPILDLPAGV
jgi:hypothetical protein